MHLDRATRKMDSATSIAAYTCYFAVEDTLLFFLGSRTLAREEEIMVKCPLQSQKLDCKGPRFQYILYLRDVTKI
jgi:hypothetical protein